MIILVIHAVLALVASVPWSSADMTVESGLKETVVLLHGLGRSSRAMWLLEARLEDAGFKVENLDYHTIDSTPEQALAEVTEKINACCLDTPHTVHYVGHSLGGLMVRAYLAEFRPVWMGRVVLIGTPNQGTELVDRVQDHWWGQLAGPTAMSLGTGENSFPNSLPLPDYPVGVIAGVSGSGGNDFILPGLDDGLVPLEATKLEGMHDFIVFESGHAMMRYDKAIAHQVIEFLRHGRFDRTSEHYTPMHEGDRQNEIQTNPALN